MKEEICKGKTANWIVVKVEPQVDYKLILTFITGEKKIYDATKLLNEPNYEQLKDLSFFMNVNVTGDSISWSDEIDIAPEHLYECSVPMSDEEYAKVSEKNR